MIDLTNCKTGNDQPIHDELQGCRKTLASTKPKTINENQTITKKTISIILETTLQEKETNFTVKPMEKADSIQKNNKESYIKPTKVENHNSIELLKLLNQRHAGENLLNFQILRRPVFLGNMNSECVKNVHAKNTEIVKPKNNLPRKEGQSQTEYDRQLASSHIDESIQSVIDGIRKDIDNEKKLENYSMEEKENCQNIKLIPAKSVHNQLKELIRNKAVSKNNCQKQILSDSAQNLTLPEEQKSAAVTAMRHYDDDVPSSSEDENMINDGIDESEDESIIYIRDKYNDYQLER